MGLPDQVASVFKARYPALPTSPVPVPAPESTFVWAIFERINPIGTRNGGLVWVFLLAGCAAPPAVAPPTAAATLARIEENLANARELAVRFRPHRTPDASHPGVFKIRGQDQFLLRMDHDGLCLISDGKNAVLQDRKVRYWGDRPVEPGAARHTLGLLTRFPYPLELFLLIHLETMLEIENGCWNFFRISEVCFGDSGESEPSLEYTVSYTFKGTTDRFHVRLWFDREQFLPVRKATRRISGDPLAEFEETYDVDLAPRLADGDFEIPPDPMETEFQRK